MGEARLDQGGVPVPTHPSPDGSAAHSGAGRRSSKNLPGPARGHITLYRVTGDRVDMWFTTAKRAKSWLRSARHKASLDPNGLGESYPDAVIEPFTVILSPKWLADMLSYLAGTA